MRGETDVNAALQSLKRTSWITGESVSYLRKGCREGRIPHVVRGSGSNAQYLVNVPLYQAMLDRESMSNTKAPAGVPAPTEAEDEIAEQLSHFDNITVRVQRQGGRHG